MNFKIKILLFFILSSILIQAQEIKIWNKTLKEHIVVHQKVSDDSTFLFINGKENMWLGRNVNIKTANYWNNAPIEITADCCSKNLLIIKRTFLGNTIVGDKLYFKRNKGKYYFNVLKEFEQKAQQ